MVDDTSNTNHRRRTDMLEPKSDHDLLIRHAVKIDNLCALMSSLNTKFEFFATRVDDRCNVRHNDIQYRFTSEHEGRMDITTSRWLIGLLVLVISGIIGTVGYNQVELQKQRNTHNLITHQIKTNTENIKQNQKTIGEVQQIILRKINMGE